VLSVWGTVLCQTSKSTDLRQFKKNCLARRLFKFNGLYLFIPLLSKNFDNTRLIETKSDDNFKAELILYIY